VLEHDPDRAAPAWLTAGSTEDEVLGLLKTGKEAEVFIVERRTLDGSRSALLAHKRYRPTKVSHKGELQALGFTRARSFANDAKYHEGRKFRRSREARAVERMTDLGKRILAERWPGQELDTLVRATEAGVTVPYPVEFTGDGLLMQLLGDDGVAAPRLVNARLDPDQLACAFAQVQDELRASGQGSRVYFLGALSSVDVAYQAADCLVHPTLEDTFAMVVLEALAHGLPVVVSSARYCGIAPRVSESAQ